MPRFTFTSPDGKTYDVDGPEGSTAEQAWEVLKGQLKSSPMSADQRGANLSALRGIDNQADLARAYRERMGVQGDGPIDRLVTGIGAAGSRAAAGLVAPVVGLVSDEAAEGIRRRAREAEAAAAEAGGLGTAGQVVGDVALSAAPIGAVNKLAQARKLGAGATALTDVAANAAYSAATAPEDRGGAALWGGGGAVAGQALPRALARVAKPYEAKAGTQAMLDAGITPTLGDAMAADKRLLAPAVRAAERVVESTPVAGSVLRRTREKALEQLQKATREAALPPGAAQTDAATVDTLTKAFKTTYDDALHPHPFPVRAVKAWDPEDAANGLALEFDLDADKAKKVAQYVQNIIDGIDFTASPTAAAAHHAESVMKRKAWQYKKSLDPDQQAYGDLLHEVAKDWGRAWRGELPEQAAKRIAQIDAQYAKFVPVRRAAGLPANVAAPDEYTPKHLLQSIRAGDRSPTKSRFIAGEMPQQGLATAAASLSAPHAPDLLSKVLTLGAGAAPFVGLSVPAGLGIAGATGYAAPQFQKYLLGGYVPQQQIAADALRRSARLASQAGRSAAMTEKQKREYVLRRARELQKAGAYD